MATRSQEVVPEHWEKLVALIDKAKADEGLSEILRHGKPTEVTARLREEVGMSMDDLARLFDDLEHIADRDSLSYWSPLQ